MATNNNYALQILAIEAAKESGLDDDELSQHFHRWEPNREEHANLLDRLGGRVSEGTPLRFICSKKLTNSDVNGHYNRFVFHSGDVSNYIAYCFSLQQRQDLCDQKPIPVEGHDQSGRKWELEFRMRVQPNNNSSTYILQGKWTKMARKNRWEEGDELKVWGFPYSGTRYDWKFGEDNGYNKIYFVFTL